MKNRNPLTLLKQAAPATPATGLVALYAVDGTALLMKDDTGTVRSFTGFTQAQEICLLNAAGNTNQAGGSNLAANVELFSTSKTTRSKVDLSLASQHRIQCVLSAAGSAAGAAVKIQYRTTDAAAWAGTDLAATAGAGNLVLGGATPGLILDTGWVDIASGAKVNDCFLAMTAAVSFGVTAPSFGMIRLFLR